MQDVEDGEEEKDSETKKSVSVDDLNDALMEETTDESEAEGAAASDVPSKEGEEAGVDIAGQWATLSLLLNLTLFKELTFVENYACIFKAGPQYIFSVTFPKCSHSGKASTGRQRNL